MEDSLCHTCDIKGNFIKLLINILIFLYTKCQIQFFCFLVDKCHCPLCWLAVVPRATLLLLTSKHWNPKWPCFDKICSFCFESLHFGIKHFCHLHFLLLIFGLYYDTYFVLNPMENISPWPSKTGSVNIQVLKIHYICILTSKTSHVVYQTQKSIYRQALGSVVIIIINSWISNTTRLDMVLTDYIYFFPPTDITTSKWCIVLQ